MLLGWRDSPRDAGEVDRDGSEMGTRWGCARGGDGIRGMWERGLERRGLQRSNGSMKGEERERLKSRGYYMNYDQLGFCRGIGRDGG